MERICTCFILLLISVGQGEKNLEDPCQATWHTVLNETHRSTGFDTRPSDIPYCDDQLKRGWYRFVGLNETDTEIATECPGIDTCGTVTPLWMNGTHPDKNDGIVVRRLCGRNNRDYVSGSCCDVNDEIFVKKCNNFYIYYLIPTINCPSAYCAGSAPRCPVGKWSSSKFEPCRDLAPVLKIPPIVLGPNVNANQSFDFRCKIDFGPNDTDQVFEVLWTFNEKSDPSIKLQTLTGSQRVAILSGDKLKTHTDTEVSCQVSTYYLLQGNKNVYKSKANLFGVQELKLTGPNMRGNTSFDFECEVTFGSNDTNQQIEVVWLFDDKQDPKIKPIIITANESKVILDGTELKNHINTNIGCQARLVYEGLDIKTEFRKSNTFFAGIYINSNWLKISDSEGEKDITVFSTIPVVCEQDVNCCLTFNMKINKKSVVFLKDSCDYKICLSDWDPASKQASINMTVVPSRNSIQGEVREAVLSFEEFVLTDTSPYSEIFNSFELNPVQVVIQLEAGFQCSITGDPHFHGFDFSGVYDLYQTGDYTVYEVKYRDFLVQIRTWPCFAVTCICGVVVKEKNDIIKVYGCDTNSGSLLASTVDIVYKLSPGTVLMRSANGQHVGILLPSGSEVKIDIYDNFMNAYIQTPAYDRNEAKGICGTNDGKPENDFTHSDGTMTPICPGSFCIPTEFMESWRVAGAASMFEVSPNKVHEEPTLKYCACTASSKRQNQDTCSYRQHIQKNKLMCQDCVDITQHLKPSPWGQPDQVQIQYKHQSVKPVDPNKKWPNDQGVTELQAKDLCNRSVQKSQLFSKCQNLGDLVGSAMSECLGDILNGGTTDVLDAVTSSFTNKCQLTLATDKSNYQTSSDGEETLNPGVIDVCPPECSTHGKCGQSGKCECVSGWEGETCQIETGKGPQISYTTGGPLCYASQKSCDSVQFDKSNVNIHQKLKCRVQTVSEQGHKIDQPIIVDSTDQFSSRVTCPLPKTELSSLNYTISVTADGVTYGNELPVYTFDSTCMDCDDFGCNEKNTSCHIDNVCYRDGEINKKNDKQVCDVSKNLTDWSNQTFVRNINTMINSTQLTTTSRHNMDMVTPTDDQNRNTTSASGNMSNLNESSTALSKAMILSDNITNYSVSDLTQPNNIEGLIQYLENFIKQLQELIKKIKN